MILIDMKEKINNFSIHFIPRVLLIALSLITFLFITGCNKSNNQEIKVTETTKKEFAKRLKKEKEAEEAIRADKFILLSLKYDVDVLKTQAIIEEYEAAIMILEKESRPFRLPNEKPLIESNTPLSEQLPTLFRDLNVKYNIPKNKLASMLIDYNIMIHCKVAATE